MSTLTRTQSGTATGAALLPRACPQCGARYPADFKVCPRDAAELEGADANADDPLLGQVLGDAFRVVRAIGEGGTARVYEARHIRLSNKRFAVKVMHEMYAAQPTLVQRFQREAEAAAGIDHPNVVDVYDVHRAPDGRPYIVTEFLAGRDLGDLLKQKKKIDVALGVRIIREVCAALSAAHARGIVHRDMKPENVFLVGESAELRVKVLDFGISKVLDSVSEALTRTGMIVGTPGYMAPEQAGGGVVDRRTDVYATGAILYRALTGRAPFSGSDTAEVLSAVLTEEPRRPRSLEASIPDALEIVIQRAMSKAAEERYQSMQELDQALLPFDATHVAALLGDVDAKSETSAQGERNRTPPSITIALTENAARTGRQVRQARPSIVFFSVIGYLWFVGCVVDAVVAVLTSGRSSSGGDAMTRIWAAAAGTGLVSTGPLVLWVRHVAKSWKNSVRAVELSRLVRRVTLSAIISYAAAVLALRLIMATTGTSGLDSSTPFVSLSLAVVTFAGATSAFLFTRWRKQADIK